MTIGESVDGCRVSWKDAGHGPTPGQPRSGSSGMWRRLTSAQVRHVGRNTVEWTRPKSGEIVRRRLTNKYLEITTPDGRDLVAAWREPTDMQTPAARQEFDAWLGTLDELDLALATKLLDQRDQCRHCEDGISGHRHDEYDGWMEVPCKHCHGTGARVPEDGDYAHIRQTVDRWCWQYVNGEPQMP